MRRLASRVFVCGAVSLLVLALPVVAEELLGVLTKVDLDTKKVTVVTAEDKEVEVSITDETEYVTPKKTGKIDLERVAKGLERIQEKGRKGLLVLVTHENSVASKIETKVAAKKKGGRQRKAQ